MLAAGQQVCTPSHVRSARWRRPRAGRRNRHDDAFPPNISATQRRMTVAASYLDVLVEYLVGHQAKDLSAPAMHAGKRVFMDVLGANLRGSEEPENVQLARLVMQNANPGRATATLLRAGFPLVDEQSAALVNGTQAPAVELDDGYRLATSHSGVYVMAGSLALAEALGKSGAEMLNAFVLGYEVVSRAATAVRSPKFLIHPHGVFAPLGTAVAAAKLKGFGREQFREAIK